MPEPSGGLTPGLLSRDPEEVANGINAAFSHSKSVRFACVYDGDSFAFLWNDSAQLQDFQF